MTIFLLAMVVCGVKAQEFSDVKEMMEYNVARWWNWIQRHKICVSDPFMDPPPLNPLLLPVPVLVMNNSSKNGVHVWWYDDQTSYLSWPVGPAVEFYSLGKFYQQTTQIMKKNYTRSHILQNSYAKCVINSQIYTYCVMSLCILEHLHYYFASNSFLSRFKSKF